MKGDDAIPMGAWTHVATTSSAGSLKLYVNGVLKKTIAQSAFVASNAPDYVTLGHDFALGCSGSSSMPGNYSGALDDFKIWDHELTAAEIAKEAN